MTNYVILISLHKVSGKTFYEQVTQMFVIVLNHRTGKMFARFDGWTYEPKEAISFHSIDAAGMWIARMTAARQFPETVLAGAQIAPKATAPEDCGCLAELGA